MDARRRDRRALRHLLVRLRVRRDADGASCLSRRGGPGGDSRAPLGDAARTASAYALVAELDPFDGQAQAIVGRHALAQRDATRAVRALRSALAAGPADRATAHTDLAEAHLLAGQHADARREALAALEIAPAFERAQDLLLKIIDAQPAP